jgi:hypothetical protein
MGDPFELDSSLTKHWSGVKPALRFLKETLQYSKRADIAKVINDRIEIDHNTLDPFLISDSVEFLRLSIINLLAYKHLVCGKYLAWGRVTIYYSYFYIINCLLRLKGVALVHLDYLDEKPLTVRILRPRNSRNYRFQECGGASGHKIVGEEFARVYPSLGNKTISMYTIKERMDWNYDLFYASQATDKYALKEAENRCKNDFLDPNYGKTASSEDEAEYYNELMAGFGYEEGGTGQYQKYAIDQFTDIGKNSKYGSFYRAFFESMLQDLGLLESSDLTKEEIADWLRNAISQIKQ